MGEHGRAWRLDQASLTVLGHYAPASPFEPHAAQWIDGQLLVASYATAGAGEGALLVLRPQ